MNKPNPDQLELNEYNVATLFKACQSKEQVDSERTVSSIIFPKGIGLQSPIIYFDIEEIEKNKEKIKYMLGQTHVPHTTDRISFEITEGAFNYDGKPWTKNQMSLYCLYYLGVAAEVITPFFKRKNGQILSTLSSKIKATYWPPKAVDIYEEHQKI